ncbi:hypothetical protein DY218_02465 [Streptomyces triticagri]|uniref:Uncharacterized protein n=2 Tax=Streptomyces triticagri TaxID=2293568 RepID=A0A372MDA9_9ACTN|nr:hypothetical protein DY218_02465 [Streptomyces triticagri]
MPVDLVRARMAHPSTPEAARARVWDEVIRRRRLHGEPWGTVGVALTLPMLRRSLARLPRLAELESSELEQEVLAAVMDQFEAVSEDGAPQEVGLQLVRAGDRAAHRVLYAVQRDRRMRTTASLEDCANEMPVTRSSSSEVYDVLDRAVQAGVITALEAELIAVTRLDGESAKSCAQQVGTSVRSVFRNRSAAEQRLSAALLADEL